MEQMTIFDFLGNNAKDPAACAHKIHGAEKSKSCALNSKGNIDDCPCCRYDAKLSCDGCKWIKEGIRTAAVCHEYKNPCKRYWHSLAIGVDTKDLKDKFERG